MKPREFQCALAALEADRSRDDVGELEPRVSRCIGAPLACSPHSALSPHTLAFAASLWFSHLEPICRKICFVVYVCWKSQVPVRKDDLPVRRHRSHLEELTVGSTLEGRRLLTAHAGTGPDLAFGPSEQLRLQPCGTSPAGCEPGDKAFRRAIALVAPLLTVGECSAMKKDTDRVCSKFNVSVTLEFSVIK